MISLAPLSEGAQSKEARMLTPDKIAQVLTRAQAVVARFDTLDPEFPAKVASAQAEAKGAFALMNLGAVLEDPKVSQALKEEAAHSFEWLAGELGFLKRGLKSWFSSPSHAPVEGIHEQHPEWEHFSGECVARDLLLTWLGLCYRSRHGSKEILNFYEETLTADPMAPLFAVANFGKREEEHYEKLGLNLGHVIDLKLKPAPAKENSQEVNDLLFLVAASFYWAEFSGLRYERKAMKELKKELALTAQGDLLVAAYPRLSTALTSEGFYFRPRYSQEEVLNWSEMEEYALRSQRLVPGQWEYRSLNGESFTLNLSLTLRPDDSKPAGYSSVGIITSHRADGRFETIRFPAPMGEGLDLFLAAVLENLKKSVPL